MEFINAKIMVTAWSPLKRAWQTWLYMRFETRLLSFFFGDSSFDCWHLCSRYKTWSCLSQRRYQEASKGFHTYQLSAARNMNPLHSIWKRAKWQGVIIHQSVFFCWIPLSKSVNNSRRAECWKESVFPSNLSHRNAGLSRLAPLCSATTQIANGLICVWDSTGVTTA